MSNDRLPRYYIDQRPGAIALRDRQHDSDEFSQYAPGVLDYLPGELRADGSVEFSADRLGVMRLHLQELRAGKPSAMEWAANVLEIGAACRAQSARRDEADRHRRATDAWSDENRQKILDVMAAHGGQSFKHPDPWRVRCHLGLNGIVSVTAYVAFPSVHFEVSRDSRSDLRALSDCLGPLERLMEDLEAALAERKACKP